MHGTQVQKLGKMKHSDDKMLLQPETIVLLTILFADFCASKHTIYPLERRWDPNVAFVASKANCFAILLCSQHALRMI